MKKAYFFYCIFFLSCSNNKQKELEYLICKDSVQYWNFEWPRERSKFYGFTFSFEKGGKLKKFSFNKETNIRNIYWDIDNPEICKWSVSKDSILKIMGSKVKILKYNTDTIFTLDIKYNTKEYYVREKNWRTN